MATIVCDIGTSAVKAALIAEDGTSLEEVVQGYPGADEAPRGEIPVEAFWAAFTEAVGRLAAAERSAEATRIVMTGQMQDVILLREGAPLRPAILYYDARADAELEEFLGLLSWDRAMEITANTPDASGFPAKLLWIRAREPDVLAEDTRLLCGAHDYIAYRLTGRLRTDPTTASTTGLFDPATGRWSQEITEALGLPEGFLPEVVTADTSDGPIAEEVARELGLERSVEVIHGMGDVGATVLGSGDLSDRLACYLGTSGWILDTAAVEEPGDPERGVFNLRHPVEPKLIRVAPLLIAAGAAEWAVEQLSGSESNADGPPSAAYDALAAAAAAARPGAGGVVFLPHLAGERSPFKDPDATGLFIGLRRETGRGAVFRAVLEGIAFSLRSVAEALTGDDGVRSAGANAGDTRGRSPAGAGDEAGEPILLSGGGARIGRWPQIIADVTGRRVDLVRDAQLVGLRGVLALLGASDTPKGHAVEQEVSGSFTARSELRGLYDEQYRIYTQLYPQVKASMHALRTLHRQQGGS